MLHAYHEENPHLGVSNSAGEREKSTRDPGGHERVRDGESLTALPPAEDHLPRRTKNGHPAQ